MAYRIVSKRQLAEHIFQIDVVAPWVAEARKAGQFVIVSPDEEAGERIPLTIAGADRAAGTIRLIFQRVGKATSQLADIPEGGSPGYLVGPLGRPMRIERFGTVVCVGGGIGAAPLLPIASALKGAGNTVVTVLGARTRELLILEAEFTALSDELIVVTDDGSSGRKALVTEPLRQLCLREPKSDLAVAIGPAVMMKHCCEVTRRFAVPTQVSLNPIMVDGTGMCGGCRVQIGGETRFACVDGPEFDGHQVDFDLLTRRQTAYRDQEQWAMRQYREHKCRGGADER